MQNIVYKAQLFITNLLKIIDEVWIKIKSHLKCSLSCLYKPLDLRDNTVCKLFWAICENDSSFLFTIRNAGLSLYLF